MELGKIEIVEKEVTLKSSEKVILRLSTGHNMIVRYSDLREVSILAKELFKTLIIKSRIIKGFESDDYSRITDEDCRCIAIELLQFHNIDCDDIHDPYTPFIGFMESEYNQLGESFAKFASPYLIDFYRNSQSLYEMVRPQIIGIGEAMIPLFEGVGRISKSIADKSEEYGKVIFPFLTNVKVISDKWTESVEHLLAKYSEYLSQKESAALIASRYDWFITRDFLFTHAMIAKINELYIKGCSQEDIDAVFVNHFTIYEVEELLDELLVLEISSSFKDIIDQIKHGFSLKLYYLVIPTIMLLIEGFVVKGTNHIGHMNGKKFKELVDTILTHSSDISLKTIINDRMMAQFEHGKNIDSPISRHAIFHGADFKYGTESNAIRVLLILYNIAYAIEFMNKRDREILGQDIETFN